MSDIDVKFGASTGDLDSGVDHAKDKIGEVGRKTKEATEAANELVKKFLELAGIEFTIEGIKEFIESMGQLGLETERTMAMLGLSAEQVGNLSGIAKLTGTSMEALTTGIERLSLNIQKSTRDAFNPAAEGLKVMGLRAKDLIGLPADQYFDKLSEAISRFNPSLNLSNALMAVGGRGIAQMLPSLLLGKEHFEAFQKEVAHAQEGLAAAIPGMAETHEKLTILGVSAQSLGARIFTVLKPAIDQAVTGLTKWAQSIDSATIQKAAIAIGDFTLGILKVVGDFVMQIRGWIDELAAKAGDLQGRLASAAGGATGGAIGGAIVGGPVGAGLGFFGGGAAGFALGGGSSPGMTGDQARLDQAFFDTRIEAARLGWQKLVTVSNEGAAHVADANKKLDASSMDLGGHERMQAEMARIKSNMKVTDEYFAGLDEHAKASAKIGEITEAQKTQDLRDALGRRWSLDTGYYQDLKEAAAGNARELEKIDGEYRVAYQKHLNQLQKLDDEDRQRRLSEWQGILKPIQQAWDSQLRGLLAGTTTWAAAMKNIFSDLAIHIIQSLETVAIVNPLTKALSKAFDLGDLATQALKMIKATLGPIFAGVTANVAPEAGPAAPAIGASVAAAVDAVAVGMSSLDVGSYRIPGDMPAMLHRDEMVLDAGNATKGRDLFEGGGTGGNMTLGDIHVNHYGPGKLEPRQVAAAIREALRGNHFKPAQAFG